MKQFNLEEYLENPSRKVVTRDGRNVRIICTDFDNPDFPVVAEIKGHKWPISFATNGMAIKKRQLCSDLFFAPEKHEGWINVYMNCIEHHVGSLYSSKEDALKVAKDNDNYVATVKIEWEE